MPEDAKNWDNVASDYQRTYKLGINDYCAELIDFLKSGKMIFPGCRVIDIGCGVGKYGTQLAKLGCDVTLTDISGKMLEHASQNMSQFTSPWRIYRCDFTDVTGNEDVFKDGFDFSMSTMSPAICDKKTVQKMSNMTNGWCFLARFTSWKQPGRDRLLSALGVAPKPPFDGLPEDCAMMIQAVSASGFVPLVKYVDYNWCDRRTPEEMAEYTLSRVFADDSQKPEYTAVLQTAKALCGEDGLFEDSVFTKVAWIYWKTEERT